MNETPPYPGTPRWVKIFAIVAVIVLLLIAILMLTGSEHGPRRHMSRNDVALGAYFRIPGP